MRGKIVNSTRDGISILRRKVINSYHEGLSALRRKVMVDSFDLEVNYSDLAISIIMMDPFNLKVDYSNMVIIMWQFPYWWIFPPREKIIPARRFRSGDFDLAIPYW